MEPLKFLSDADVQAMHEATLKVMSEIGIIWTHKPSLDILLQAGCKMKDNRVLMPPDLVMDSVAKANKRPKIRGRNGTVNELGGGNLFFHNLGGARDVFDARTGTHHTATTEDCVNAVRLLDALPNCNNITPFFTPPDVENEMMALHMFRHALSNTTKPVQGPGIQFGHEAKYAVEMAKVIGIEPHEITLSLSPVSPLTMHDIAAQAIMDMAEAGVIHANLPAPTGGATSPMTITGSLVQQNAETLAPLVLAQILNPGCGVVYCGRLGLLEPRTGLIWGGVELGISSAATVQLGHYYGFAVNVYGFSTNAHTLDAQNAFERGLNASLPALAGADELSGIGEMEAGVMGSFAQMVLDNELAKSIHRQRQGLSADAEHLAVEVIGNVMDSNRNYLASKHTLKHLRAGEMALTKLAERNSWDTWEDKMGRKQMADHATDEAERILREHTVPPLEPAQEAELNRILAAAERETVKKK
ncbi:MAG: trimethylamine methyltransferase family protein [Anaerolineales bacterium]|uniref:trimethylamine methyltransferase family protein n=1 Tax=Candidatus Villigracilis vicinus TaxID=3140679 RepID=UPI003136B8E0|nr:trimethylamine methyltransferase family protein [Anaerolineales bacterium]MBK7448538.1 trimethylamine methyltransferase family protein [Anaerolineales bacterium]MBK9782543.1 trimethylamine methyltransferase family protein [Anaerolineales bacterium]